MSIATVSGSWAEAEMTVYLKLLTATGHTDKKNAFLGYMPPMLNAWVFSTGPGGGNEQTTWPPTKTSFHIQASIIGHFTERTAAQAFVMKVAYILPILNEDRVQCFRIRIGGFPEPMPEIRSVGNENRQFLVHTVEIGCELVFTVC